MRMADLNESKERLQRSRGQSNPADWHYKLGKKNLRGEETQKLTRQEHLVPIWKNMWIR